MQKHLILGIDPGFKGGLVLYSYKNEDDLGCGLIKLWPTPLMPEMDLDRVFSGRKAAARQRLEIDGRKLLSLLLPYKDQIALAVVEKVSAAPKQGVTSMFRFGEGYGLLKGILLGLDIKAYLTPPAVWKTAMNLSSNKAQSFDLARKTFGETAFSLYFNKKKNEGIVEAALLAVYGLRYRNDLKTDLFL